MVSYERGDVLENLIRKGTYTLVVHSPAEHHDEDYLVLDLILQPVDLTERIQPEEGAFRIPGKALGETH